jgi:hypothetical protein
MAKTKDNSKPRVARFHAAEHLMVASMTITGGSLLYDADRVWRQYDWDKITKKQLTRFRGVIKARLGDPYVTTKVVKRPGADPLVVKRPDIDPWVVTELDLEDWAAATGQVRKTLTRSELIALGAWRHDHGVELPNPFEHLEPKRKARHRPVDRSGEPWGARLSKQLRMESAWEAENNNAVPWGRWYLRIVTKSLRSVQGSFADTMCALAFLGKGWGRVTRKVLFKDGKKRQVIAVRAAGRGRRIAITRALQRFYLLLVPAERRRVVWVAPEPDVVFDRTNFWRGHPPLKPVVDPYRYSRIGEEPTGDEGGFVGYRQPCPQWAAIEPPRSEFRLEYPDSAQRATLLAAKRERLKSVRLSVAAHAALPLELRLAALGLPMSEDLARAA